MLICVGWAGCWECEAGALLFGIRCLGGWWVALCQGGYKKKVHDTMPKTPPDSRFREIYLPTYYYLARNPSTNLLKSQFEGFPGILDRKYSQPKIILLKREMTTDIGVIWSRSAGVM